MCNHSEHAQNNNSKQCCQFCHFLRFRCFSLPRSIGSIELAIYSNAEKFRCLYSHHGSCMPSSPKEYISPCIDFVDFGAPQTEKSLQKITTKSTMKLSKFGGLLYLNVIYTRKLAPWPTRKISMQPPCEPCPWAWAPPKQLATDPPFKTQHTPLASSTLLIRRRDSINAL